MRAPGRAYHDEAHLDEVLGRYDEVAAAIGWRQPVEVLIALLFHDVVYQPGARDNEARSAEMARDSMAAHLPPGSVDGDRVAALILLTARHATLGPGDVDDEAALFLDCDMAILGAEPARFDAYERGVASEYAVVPEELYRRGRRAFLERVLSMPRIFLSQHFHDRLDGPARDNVRRGIEALSPPPG